MMKIAITLTDKVCHRKHLCFCLVLEDSDDTSLLFQTGNSQTKARVKASVETIQMS